MLDHNIGPVPDLALRSLDAPTQIDFLVVKKEPLIKESNPIEHAAPDDAVSSRYPVDLCRLKWVRPGAVHSSQQSRLWKFGRQARHGKEIVERGWKHSGRRLPRSVASHQPPTGQADLRIRVHVVNRKP